MRMDKEKVIVGLSGGIDSAVSALLLSRAGHDVSALFMRNWDSALNDDVLGNPNSPDEVCPQEKDWLDACAVASYLGIPISRVDFVEEYWSKVFAVFLAEYKAGRTPNPDVLCNSEIKFKAFLDHAMESGAERIAMGHYARTEEKGGAVHLLKGLDPDKDQSYFLCRLTQEALSRVIFPVGALRKSEVREIAREAGLPRVLTKKESTGICFIGERRFREFLKNYLPAKEGPIVDESGHVLGTHEGVWYYTIGERHGLSLGGAGEPWYVLKKDVAHDALVVGRGHDHPLLRSNRALITDLSFPVAPFSEGRELGVKFRYRSPDVPVRVTSFDGQRAWISYPTGARAVAPGQAAVFYDGDELVAGGTIDETYEDETRRA